MVWSTHHDNRQFRIHGHILRYDDIHTQTCVPRNLFSSTDPIAMYYLVGFSWSDLQSSLCGMLPGPKSNDPTIGATVAITEGSSTKDC